MAGRTPRSAQEKRQSKGMIAHDAWRESERWGGPEGGEVTGELTTEVRNARHYIQKISPLTICLDG